MRHSLVRQDAAENSIMQTISIAVSAILIAAGLVTAPSLINNARDANAQGDLANAAQAQEYAIANSGTYSGSAVALASTGSGAVKMTLSRGPGNLLTVLSSDGAHYAAFAASKSGALFWRDDSSTGVNRVTGVSVPGAGNLRSAKAVGTWPAAPSNYPESVAWPASWDDLLKGAHTADLTSLAGIAPSLVLANPAGPNRQFAIPSANQGTVFVVNDNNSYHWYDITNLGGGHITSRLVTGDGAGDTATVTHAGSYVSKLDAVGPKGTVTSVGMRLHLDGTAALVTKFGIRTDATPHAPDTFDGVTVYDNNSGMELVVFRRALTDDQSIAIQRYLETNYLGDNK